jgi:hypothetical protein
VSTHAGPLDAIPMVSPAEVQDPRTTLDAFLAWLGDAQTAKPGRGCTISLTGIR